jgi:hypothetical protein
MSDNIQLLTTHDLWIEARKMSISLQQLATDATTLRITWTNPPAPYKAYAGAVVVLSETPLPADAHPEDGKRYVASSNWAAPADVFDSGAKVVASYYSYFGDDITITSVDVSNTDPTKLYYAAIYACTNVLQYYPIGIQSYPLESSRFEKSSEAYAGSIPTAVEPPVNPVNGQTYFDPTSNKVLVWNQNALAWIEAAEQTMMTGDNFPVVPKQLYANLDNRLRFFIAGMWVDCNSTNTRIKAGGGWVPLGNVTTSVPAVPAAGDVQIAPKLPATGVSNTEYQLKVFTLGQWLNLSTNLIQFETSPGVWENVVFGEKLVATADPFVPDVGFMFYKGSTKNLFTWNGEDWTRADTESEGTPTTDKVGIGDDGSYDERVDLIRVLKTQMGWPSVCIELNEEHFNVAIDNAIQTFRQRADNAYQHRYIMYTLVRGQQVYYLNDPRNKTDRVVNILRIGRVNQLGSAQLNDPVYGQLFVPSMMSAGTFDLVSIHLMHQLSETFERIFAGNLLFTWEEAPRQLTIHRSISLPQERVVLEAVLERSEQELLNDRWCQQWLQGWAMAELKETLGMIRSKYSTVAGPNGGLTLNGDMLISEARLDFEDLQRQLLDYEVGNGGINFGNTSFYIG